MGFHCNAWKGVKIICHTMKNSKAGDLIPIACCQNCGLLQLKDELNELDLLEFYKSKYRVECGKQDRHNLKHVDKAGVKVMSRLKEIAFFIRKNTKLPDIGSGEGKITYILSRMGAEASRIYPSRGYLEFGKNYYSINVEQKRISQLVDSQLYQIVIMFHVMEHLSNPLKVIRKVHQILKLGGLFVLELANLGSKTTSLFNIFFKARTLYFTCLSLIGSLTNSSSVQYIENKDVISLVCQKANAKKFKRPTEYNPLAVGIAKSRVQCRNLKEYILNGVFFKFFKKIPGTIKEGYFSHGKDPKMILEAFFIREDLVNDNQI